MEGLLHWITIHQQMIYIVILMIFVGIEVIGRVPSVLHTPLMSGANAIHGVVIIGAIIVMGQAESDNYLALILGFLAVILGTLNVVGGFVVTDRMLFSMIVLADDGELFHVGSSGLQLFDGRFGLRVRVVDGHGGVLVGTAAIQDCLLFSAPLYMPS